MHAGTNTEWRRTNDAASDVARKITRLQERLMTASKIEPTQRASFEADELEPARDEVREAVSHLVECVGDVRKEPLS
jgi:hypothetical protein